MKFEQVLSEKIGPIAMKVNQNKMLSSIAEGFMRTTPITLGIALFAILANLPVTGWTEWLSEIGMKGHLDAALGASANVLALYISFSIANAYALKNKENGISAGFISLAGFIIMMPQTIATAEGEISALSTNYLGANGLVVALFSSLIISWMYVKLTKKGIVFKMPDSVPPMVSDSLGPVFVSMIIFTFTMLVRIGFGYSDFGSIFNFIQEIITTPLLSIGLSIPAMIFFYALANFVWFFGIHPNTIYGPINPLLTTMVLANIEAMQKGDVIPYAAVSMVIGSLYLGSSGNTLGLVACMCKAKSKRYRSMFKLSVVPNIFNINEPIIFGTPLMLNPIFFIPMVFSCVVMGIVTALLIQIVPTTFNPLMDLLPWTTPFFVKAFLAGGFGYLCIILLCFVINALMYLPFFKIADKQAYEAEQAEEQTVLEEQA